MAFMSSWDPSRRSMLIVLLLSVCAFTCIHAEQQEDKLDIARIQSYAPNQSGFAGGSLLKIRGFGFSNIMDENKVFIGAAECPIAESDSNNRLLTCTIPPNELEQAYEMQVFIRGNKIECSWCKVWYAYWLTPFMYDVIPSSCWEGCVVNLYGGQRQTRNLLTFDEIKLGDYTCETPTLEQSDDSDEFYYDKTIYGGESLNYIPFYAPPAEAGVYAPQFNVEGAYGVAKWFRTAWKTNDSHDYIYRMIPQINSLSQNAGSTEGLHRLEIFGTGFSSTLANNKVWIGGVAATVKKLTETPSLIVETGKLVASDVEYQRGNSGVIRKLWTSNRFGSADPNNQGWTTIDPVLTEIVPTAEVLPLLTDSDNYSQMLEGVFTAPAAGEYTFFVSTDDYGRMRIDCGGEGGEVEFYNTYWNSFRQIEMKTNGVGTCTLTEGQRCPFRAYQVQGGGGNHMTIGMIAPKLPEVESPKNFVGPIQEMQIFSSHDFEVHEITVNNVEDTSKKWQIRYGNSTSSNLAWNADVSQVRSALYAIGFNWYYHFERISLNAAGEPLTESSISWTFGSCDGSEEARILAEDNEQEDIQNDERMLDGEEVTGYLWRFTADPDVKQVADDDFFLIHSFSSAATVQHKTVQESSEPLDGEYFLKYDDEEIGPIAWNHHWANLHYTFRRAHPDLLELKVITSYGRPRLGYGFWLVLPDEEKEIEVSRVELTGGTCPNRPTVEIKTAREENREQQLWLPIPNEFLSTYHDADDMQVIVETNGITSSCVLDQCSYAYDDDKTPKVETWSMEGTVITFQGSGLLAVDEEENDDDDGDDLDADLDESDGEKAVDSEGKAIKIDAPKPSEDFSIDGDQDSDDQDDVIFEPEEDEDDEDDDEDEGDEEEIEIVPAIVVTVGDSECIVMEHTEELVRCSLANTVAGVHYPAVQVPTRGAAKFVNGLGDGLQVQLDIYSVSPTHGSIYGGTNIVITGTGFPASFDSPYYAFVIADGLDCHITAVSHHEIRCTTEFTPEPNHSGELAVHVESAAAYASYTVLDDDTPVVLSVTPETAGPYIKTSLSIDLADNVAITNPEDIVVYVGDDICWYEGHEGNTLQCWVIGSQLGRKDLTVHFLGLGCSEPRDFIFEFELVNIEPSSGSLLGGTLLNLTGTGFATQDKTNLAVQIGEGSDMWCTIEEIVSNNEMTCRTPPASASYTVGEAVETLVHLRAVLPSWCHSCLFTFSEDSTPGITAVSPEFGQYGDIEITTTGLAGNISASDLTVMIGDRKCQNVSLSAEGVVACEFLAEEELLAPGFYSISILSDTLGYARNSSNLVYDFREQFTSLSPSSGPAGMVTLTVEGNGFTQDSIVKLGTHDCTITEMTSTSVTFDAHLPSNANGQLAFSHNGEASTTLSYTASSTLNITLSGAVYEHEDFSAATLTFNVGGNVQAATNLSFDIKIGGFDVDLTFDDETNKLSGTVRNLAFGNLLVHGTYTYQDEQDATVAGHVVVNSDSVYIQVLDETLATSVLPDAGSFGGLNQIVISGQGFDSSTFKNNEVKICGHEAEVIDAKFDALTIQVPQMVSKFSVSNYGFGGKPSMLRSDTQINFDGRVSSAAFDSDSSVFFYTWDDQVTCYFGWDFGENRAGQVTSVRLFPALHSAGGPDKVFGSVIEGSNDLLEWEQIYHFTEEKDEVFVGWNSYDINSTSGYRYLRYNGGTSGCWMGEFEFYGHEYYSSEESELECEVTVNVNSLSQDGLSYSYSDDLTPMITFVTPQTGGTKAQAPVSLYFDHPVGEPAAEDVSVWIDGIECSDVTIDDVLIHCTSGQKQTADLSQVYDQIFGSNIVVLFKDLGVASAATGVNFKYVDRWSDPLTWGGAYPPQAGFSAHIPAGQYILVDQNVMDLNLVLIEGTVEFEDRGPGMRRKFEAKYIFINGGRLIAGTEDEPLEMNLTITLHGEPYDKHLETFGNKFLAVRGGSVDLHGKRHDKTWTTMFVTSVAGEDLIILSTSVDWQVGDRIAIASTSHKSKESEAHQIKAIVTFEWQGKDISAIRLKKPLKYDHFAGVEQYGDWEVEMRAEVALLSRNIRFRGKKCICGNKYGAHMMFAGEGSETSIGRISNVEFFHAGQAWKLGRYPINFHMLGEVTHSYVKDCSFRHNYNRAITLRGVHNMVIEGNVVYSTMGHAIFLEEGVETGNRFLRNVVMKTLRSWQLLNSDQIPASFYITNPNNHFVENRAAGSPRFGFWFDLPEHPTGLSATDAVCPRGLPLGTFEGNSSHSNGWYGLRIYEEYTPRENPCEEPGVNNFRQAIFEDFTAWKNNRNGVISERTGAIRFTNIKVIDNRLGGIEISVADLAPFRQMVIDNSLVVGRSYDNSSGDAKGRKRGIIGPRSEGLFVSQVDFYQWDLGFRRQNACLSTCSHCSKIQFADSGARTITVEKLNFCGCTSRYVWFEYPYNGIIHDLDGSLTFMERQLPDGEVSRGGWVTPYQPHLHVEGCYPFPWDYDGLVCNDSVTMRRVVLYSPLPEYSFRQVDLKIERIEIPRVGVIDEEEDHDDVESATGNLGPQAGTNPSGGWAFPILVGSAFNIHFNDGIDFSEINMDRSHLWGEDEWSLLRFDHIATREKVEAYRLDENLDSYLEQFTLLDEGHPHGSFFVDVQENQTFVAVSGETSEEVGTQLLYKAHHCWGDHCSNAFDNVEMETEKRYWSNPAHWRIDRYDDSEVAHVPRDGEDVKILASWDMVLDIDTAILQSLVIEGYLTFKSPGGQTLSAHTILVKRKLSVGSIQSPIRTSAKIRLYGSSTDSTLSFTPEIPACNKCLVVVGQGQFHGNVSKKGHMKLTSDARADDESITIEEVPSGYWANQTLLLTSSTPDGSHSEEVVITKIDGTTIYFSPALRYDHIGTLQTIEGKTIDARATVAVISHNVEIEAVHTDGNTHNGTIMVGDYVDNEGNDRHAIFSMSGVKVTNMGQHDSVNPALLLTGVRHTQVTISQCSFINSDTFGVVIQDSQDITFTENVISDTVTTGLKVEDSTLVNVSNNLVLGVQNRDFIEGAYETSACYDICSAEDQNCSELAFNDNVALNCSQWGIIFPFDSCDAAEVQKSAGNSVFSAAYGIVNASNQASCSEIAYQSVFFSERIGVFSMQSNAEMRVHDLILVDNAIGLNVNTGGKNQVNAVLITDSLISGNILSDCSTRFAPTTPQVVDDNNSDEDVEEEGEEILPPFLGRTCTTGRDECYSRVAIMLSVSLEGGKIFPVSGWALDLEDIRSESNANSMAIVQNVIFSNFFEKCDTVHDVLIKTNASASDLTSPHIFRQLKMHNVDTEYKFLFDSPNTDQVGEQQCGNFVCTGLYNVLIEDEDGTLLGNGSTGATIRSIAPGGMREDQCVVKDEWNALLCDSKDYVQLVFESLDSDTYERIYSPVYLQNPDIEYNSKLNHHRDHDWRGFYTPLRRLSRYGGLIETGYPYEVFTEGTWPTSLRYRWNGSVGPDDYAIFYQGFDTPKKIGVKKNGKVIKPVGYNPETRKPVDIYDLTFDQVECGTHQYDKETQSIIFVMRGPDCEIVVHQQDSIQVSMRLELTVEEFWDTNGPTAFVDRLAAVLDINPARIVVVDIRSGSTILDFIIVEDDDETSDADSGEEESDSSGSDTGVPSDKDTSHHKELKDLFQILKTKTQSGEIAQELNTEVLNFEASVDTVAEEEPEDDEEETSTASQPLLVFISLIFTIFVFEFQCPSGK